MFGIRKSILLEMVKEIMSRGGSFFSREEKMMNSKRLVLFVAGLTLSAGLVAVPVENVWARAQGPCVDCHTMHNSQDNAVMTTDGTEPNSKLLKAGTCAACHTGTNDGGNNIPYVYTAGGPTYSATGTEGTSNTLAGGNFYYVTQNDAHGHNVDGITGLAADATLTTPPGFVTGFAAGGDSAKGQVGDTWSGQRLTCAGTYGCHGTHDTSDPFQAVSGGHHGDDSTLDGSSVTQSYRFLYGILGEEDSDWEYQPTASAHNVYMGVDKTSDAIPTSGDATRTISFLCAECHGNFHSGSGSAGALADSASVGSPWLRHPTDFDLRNASTSEYTYYNEGTGTSNPYSVVAPVGRDITTVGTGTIDTVFNSNDDALVTCISCHRAHGTPYNDLLRWDYNSGTSVIEAGGGAGNVGCFICHTTKD